MSAEQELKPCPFCGDHRVEFNHGYKCYRIDCGGTGPTYSDSSKALEKWNSAYCWKELDEARGIIGEYRNATNLLCDRLGTRGTPTQRDLAAYRIVDELQKRAEAFLGKRELR